MKLKRRNLDSTHALFCPTCRSEVLRVHPTAIEVPYAKTWLNDGDTVQGLYALLSAEQASPSGFMPMLMVGQCPICREHYSVVTVTLMRAEWDDVDDFLLHNRDVGPMTNALCGPERLVTGVPTFWLLHEYQTQSGLMHEHVFGPWRLGDTSDVVGPFGVSGCGAHGAGPWQDAARLLYTVWNGLRETLAEAAR